MSLVKEVLQKCSTVNESYNTAVMVGQGGKMHIRLGTDETEEILADIGDPTKVVEASVVSGNAGISIELRLR